MHYYKSRNNNKKKNVYYEVSRSGMFALSFFAISKYEDGRKVMAIIIFAKYLKLWCTLTLKFSKYELKEIVHAIVSKRIIRLILSINCAWTLRNSL